MHYFGELFRPSGTVPRTNVAPLKGRLGDVRRQTESDDHPLRNGPLDGSIEPWWHTPRKRKADLEMDEGTSKTSALNAANAGQYRAIRVFMWASPSSRGITRKGYGRPENPDNVKGWLDRQLCVKQEKDLMGVS
jgi:hypothetical protein